MYLSFRVMSSLHIDRNLQMICQLKSDYLDRNLQRICQLTEIRLSDCGREKPCRNGIITSHGTAMIIESHRHIHPIVEVYATGNHTTVSFHAKVCLPSRAKLQSLVCFFMELIN